jgi:hypothetical protein
MDGVEHRVVEHRVVEHRVVEHRVVEHLGVPPQERRDALGAARSLSISTRRVRQGSKGFAAPYQKKFFREGSTRVPALLVGFIPGTEGNGSATWSSSHRRGRAARPARTTARELATPLRPRWSTSADASLTIVRERRRARHDSGGHCVARRPGRPLRATRAPRRSGWSGASRQRGSSAVRSGRDRPRRRARGRA